MAQTGRGTATSLNGCRGLGSDVNVAVIIHAVSVALTGCRAGAHRGVRGRAVTTGRGRDPSSATPAASGSSEDSGAKLVP